MTDDRIIGVLIVEDLDVVKMSIVHLLNSDPHMQVVGTARNGRETLRFLSRCRPDVILMDLELRDTDCVEMIRRIMEVQPAPIIACDRAAEPIGPIGRQRLLETGAVACIELPLGRRHEEFDLSVAMLLQTVKLMSEVKVVHRWPRKQHGPVVAAAEPDFLDAVRGDIEFVGIGASTGGPPVLKTILQGLPGDFPAPLLVVQHICRGFLQGLVDWLNQSTGMKVHIAEHGETPRAGHVYLAPDDFHLTLAADRRLALSDAAPENGSRPSVAPLLRSLADVSGPCAVGVLLTGMGKDGAKELKMMRDRGSITIAQDRATSAVHGMPGEAIAIGAASCILPAEQIAPALLALSRRQTISEGALS